MGQLIHVDFGRNVDAHVPKRQLAALFGRSRRWVELRVREGMPSTMERGQRMFSPAECREWLAGHGRSVANG